MVYFGAVGIVAQCPGNSLFGHCCTSWHRSHCLGNTSVPCCHVGAHMLCPTSCRPLFCSLWPRDLVGRICSILPLSSFLFLGCWLLCSFLVLCLFLSLVATRVFLLLFLLPCRILFPFPFPFPLYPLFPLPLPPFPLYVAEMSTGACPPLWFALTNC